MKMQRQSRVGTAPLVFLSTVLAAVLSGNGVAQAKILITYDEESLVFAATDIVQATVGDSATRLTIDQVYKGSLKAGSSIAVPGLDLYGTRDADDDLNSRNFHQGDRVILFLTLREGPAPAPANQASPLPGGVYTIKADGVHASFQGSNPGPYLDRSRLKLSAEEYRTHLEERIRQTAQLKTDIHDKPLPAQADWFIAELKKRSQPQPYGSQVIAALSKRIADTHDPALITRVAARSDTQVVLSGLRWPAGRDYVADSLGDASLSLQFRLLLASQLSQLGIDYFDQEGTTPAGISPKDAADNHHYLTRLAKIASTPGVPPELMTATLAGLWRAIPDPRFHPPRPAGTNDLKNALELLHPVHASPATMESVKFYIEAITLRASIPQFHQLHSPAGEMPTLVTLGFPPQPPRIQEARPGMFSVKIQREIGALAENQQPGYTIVATNLTTGQRFTLYNESDHGGNDWFADVSLPAEAPYGSYKIQYLWVSGGHEQLGYGFTINHP